MRLGDGVALEVDTGSAGGTLTGSVTVTVDGTSQTIPITQTAVTQGRS